MEEHIKYIIDNHGNILYTSNGSILYQSEIEVDRKHYVNVIKVNGKLGHRFYPCDKCRWKNVIKNKLLMYNNTHAIYIRWNSFNRNLMSGQSQPYTEHIGICHNYIPVTGGQGDSPLIGK